MKVHLVRSKEVKPEALANVFNLLVVQEGPVQFTLRPTSISLKGDVLAWEALFQACEGFRSEKGISEDEFIVLLVAKPNDKNWFSSPDPSGRKSIFLHAGDWDNYLVDSSPESALAFQVFENLLQALMYKSLDEALSLAHDPPIGCINDMCSWKPHVTFKLRTADVCGDCLNLMEERGIPRDVIRQALRTFESLRKHMLLSRRFQQVESGDDNLPFPVAITRMA